MWMHLVNGTGDSPSPGRMTPGVVKQDKSSGGSVDTTKTRSGAHGVRMSSALRKQCLVRLSKRGPFPLHRLVSGSAPPLITCRSTTAATFVGSPPPPPNCGRCRCWTREHSVMAPDGALFDTLDDVRRGSTA